MTRHHLSTYPQVNRLFPPTAQPVSLLECYDVPRPRRGARPWIGLCMVASLDGSSVVGGLEDGNSRALSDPCDQQLLLTLRSLADVILVGASTVRRDDYGPPKNPGQRIAVVSRSAKFNFDLPLWTSGRAVLLLPEDAADVPVPSLRAGRGEVDLAAAVAQLDAEFVQAEGGATVNGLLAAADLIDELNLSLSPQIVGGNGSRIVAGAAAFTRHMELAHVLEHENFLFTRYVRDR